MGSLVHKLQERAPSGASHPGRPDVSVIVPVYDTEDYLERCLRSIMAQTHENIEIICVNDCSPDNCAEILSRLSQEDARICVIEHESNLGLGGTRNTGIRAARAEWIASVDSDDYIEQDMIAALLKGTDGGRFDVVVCGFERVDPEGRSLSLHMKKVDRLDPVPEDANPFRISNPAFWNKLWRRSLFVDNDIFFPNHIYYQDSATTPRIYSQAKRIAFIGGLYYKYLVRPDSVTNKVSDKHLLDKFRELDVVKNFLIERGLYERHGEHLRERAYNSFRYHGENVYNNNVGGDEASDTYMRYLLLMREGYLSLDDVCRDMDRGDKARALERHESLLPRDEARDLPVATSGAVPPRILPRRPRILVLTLESGENEFERSKASLASQLYTNWQHKIFSGLSNQEAHRQLYSYIMQHSDEYDLFLKLDADMLFANVNVLDWVIDYFRARADLDHLIVGCDDFMTGTQIIGVHAFSGRVSWTPSTDGLFLDPHPQKPGRRKFYSKPPVSWFLHSPDPGELQAFHFGTHRALKLVQRGRDERRTEAIVTQWTTLENVWKRYSTGGDRRHALTLLAADLVVRGQIGDEAHNYADKSLHDAFVKVAALDPSEMQERVAAIWFREETRRAWFERAVGAEGLRSLALKSIDPLSGEAGTAGPRPRKISEPRGPRGLKGLPFRLRNSLRKKKSRFLVKVEK